MVVPVLRAGHVVGCTGRRARRTGGCVSGIEGKTALVTGGGSGIGLGAARRLAADGARVTICGRTEDKLVAAAESIGPDVGEGGSIAWIVADVTVEDQLAAAVAAA